MKSVQDMLNELLSNGWSQTRLAKELCSNQPTIHRLAVCGKEPSYSLGKRIEELYFAEQTKKAA